MIRIDDTMRKATNLTQLGAITYTVEVHVYSTVFVEAEYGPYFRAYIFIYFAQICVHISSERF